MCGRYTHTADRVEFILERFRAALAPGFEGYHPSYNVAPTQMVPAVVAKDDGRYLMHMLWGIVPPWGESKDGKLTQQINVRDDTVARNAFFRGRLQSNRCIFVADGFYEWQTPAEFRGQPRGSRLPKGIHKTPFRITIPGQQLFPLAGLWRTIEIDKRPVVTAAIITTAPNSFMEAIHDRMPVILSDEQLEHWLDPSCKDLDILQRDLAPYPGAMEAYPVSRSINSGAVNDPTCIEPFDAAAEQTTPEAEVRKTVRRRKT